MKISMILEGQDFPPDIRVEKEARALTEAGHRVDIICDNLMNRPQESEWEGCRVIRVPGLPRVRRIANKLFWLSTLRNLHWEDCLKRRFLNDRPDVLHVHDLPMLGNALRLARHLGIPVISDLHENYPAASRYYFQGPSVFARLRHLAIPPSRWQMLEIRWVTEADQVLVVVDEAKERLAGLGIDPAKISVVENTEDVEYFGNISIDPEVLSRFENDFVISYIGGFGGTHRGLDTAVSAMPTILKAIPNARLLLAGRGPIRPTLEHMAEKLGVQNRITFLDWQPFDKVPSLISASNVCLVPHHANPHTEATSPHKLFQYMLMKRPVIVSSVRPLKRVVEATGAGLVFRAGDSQSLADTVVRMKDNETRRSMAEAGYRAVMEHYNWRNTSRKLLDVYERIRTS